MAFPGRSALHVKVVVHIQYSWRKLEALPNQNSKKCHKKTAQKQERKSWSLNWVMAEQAQGRTGYPNPEKLERVQKTPMPGRQRGC